LFRADCLLGVEPFFVPAYCLAGEGEFGPEWEGAAVDDVDGADEGCPAAADDVVEDADGGEIVDAAVVHASEVAGVIEMEVEVDVVGPDSEVDGVFVEDSDAGQRFEALADGEQGDTDEAVDVGHSAVYLVRVQGSEFSVQGTGFRAQ